MVGMINEEQQACVDLAKSLGVKVRKAPEGQWEWALPEHSNKQVREYGGYLDTEEEAYEDAIRVLREREEL